MITEHENSVVNLLREARGQVAAAACDVVEWDGDPGVVTALVDQFIEAMEGERTHVNVSEAGDLDVTQSARLLRAIEAQCIESVRSLYGTPGYAAKLSRLRDCVREAMPPSRIAPDQLHFYEQLMEGATEELPEAARPLADFLRTVMTALGEMVYVHDLEGNLLYVNKRGMALTGFTRDDLHRGMSIFDFVAPESLPMVEQRLVTMGAAAWSPTLFYIFTRDGQRIPLEVNTRPLIEHGKLKAVIGVGRDIRLERRLEDEVRRAHAYFDSVMDNVPIGGILTDLCGTIAAANPAAVRLMGAESALELVGRSIKDLTESADPVLDALHGAIQSAQEFRHECKARSVCGKDFHCELTAVPRKSSDGVLEGAIILLADISRETRLRQVLVQSEKLSALGKIVAGVSHELNNPLTGIIGYTQLILAEDLSPSMRARVNQIAQEASRSQRIVQNLLSFARKRESSMAPEDVNRILRDTLALREYQLRVDGIEVHTDFADPVPSIHADADALQSVFLNIITNAQQALSAAGPSLTPKTIHVATQLDDGLVRVRISDNGPGIPEEHQSKVFDPFFTTKEPGMGTGLGLSVSYGIIEDHGGRLVVESQPGQGASFTILLPLSPNRPIPPVRV